MTPAMTPERWQQIKAIFDEALDCETGRREAFLAEACANDAALRAEVETLLAGHRAAEGFINQPAAAQAAHLLDIKLAPDALLGTQIGPYKVLQEIGHGGMGQVYLAVRADDEYKKRVALKVVKRGMDTQDVIRRFRSERQILAGLDHPNIAKLLDGGTTEDGLPYFAMEYVEGKPITDYCDHRKLPTSERLNLFRQVCAAVQYAHQNLVVHRDLKPGNILVTEDGTPKLLDFGIAKLLNPELSVLTIDPTATAMRLMTPEYASPEQVRGETVTTASDVYSLGVVLYELLTGHRPYRVKSRSLHDIVRIVCEEEPEKPSTAVSRVDSQAKADGTTHDITPASVSRARADEPERLQRRLRGDLDNIVLMAMRKEPQRRYTTVNQLSEDIRRHLDELPVIARKDTLGYRSAKFVQRNKGGVIAVTAFLLLIIASTFALGVQSIRLTRERDKATRVSDFLVGLFQISDPGEAQGNKITAREMLDKGAATITNDLKDQPETQATLMNTIGEVYVSLGLYKSARPLLEQALQTRKASLGESNQEVAESLHNLANLLRHQADYKTAEPMLRQALSLHRRLFGNEHPRVATTMNELGLLLQTKGDYAEAETLLRQALAMRRKLFGNDHKDVAASLGDLALLLQEKRENLAEVEAMQRESLALHRKLFGNDHLETGASLHNLAMTLDGQGKYGEAEAMHREALAVWRKVYGNEHPNIATALSQLAASLYYKGDFAAAEQYYREALAMQRRIYGDEHPDVASTLNNLGALLYDRRDFAAAEPVYREALTIRRKLLGDSHLGVANLANNLANLLRDKGDLNAAETLYREALTIKRKVLSPGTTSLAYTLIGLGGLLVKKNDPTVAEPLLRESVTIMRDKLPKGDWQTAVAESSLGVCLSKLQRFEEAEQLLVAAYPIIKQRHGDKHEQTQRALQRLLDLYTDWKRKEKAAEYRALLDLSKK